VVYTYNVPELVFEPQKIRRLTGFLTFGCEVSAPIITIIIIVIIGAYFINLWVISKIIYKPR